jgi:hypothetical protein
MLRRELKALRKAPSQMPSKLGVVERENAGLALELARAEDENYVLTSSTSTSSSS